MFVIAFFAAVAALIVVVVLAGQAAERAKREKYAAFARELGWHYLPEKLRRMEDRYPGFDLFRRGGNRYGAHFLTGYFRGFALTAFEYHYEVSSGSGSDRSTTHHHFTVVMLQPDFELHPLTIREEGFFDKVGAVFGWEDINFESAEFSRRFHVTSPVRRWAYDVITPRTMEFLLDRRPPPMRMDHQRLMISQSRMTDLFQILPMCEAGAMLLEGIPAFARHRRDAHLPPSLPPRLPPPLPQTHG